MVEEEGEDEEDSGVEDEGGGKGGVEVEGEDEEEEGVEEQREDDEE